MDDDDDDGAADYISQVQVFFLLVLFLSNKFIVLFIVVNKIINTFLFLYKYLKS